MTRRTDDILFPEEGNIENKYDEMREGLKYTIDEMEGYLKKQAESIAEEVIGILTNTTSKALAREYDYYDFDLPYSNFQNAFDFLAYMDDNDTEGCLCYLYLPTSIEDSLSYHYAMCQALTSIIDKCIAKRSSLKEYDRIYKSLCETYYETDFEKINEDFKHFIEKLVDDIVGAAWVKRRSEDEFIQVSHYIADHCSYPWQ